ncbi:hypothetical protein HRG_000851 [Hirsutella rhossiliensis]|uniref:Uncharacterized protein n=1 Tax=Hirsutella rhossiliensis TaxID=111463 RepID=A0A9P8SNB4_9HYPO|nr:uncharacterized protein HRG_00851 [Hirsutella rhossiliensis]KAH0968209.1 hypothetical protein HRG_00851 [Hirsutella rhossiliensis]
MAHPDEPRRRRFTPVPIETTFQSVRKPPACLSPHPELTPDPSPPSTSPTISEPQRNGRFHPQLIETSRRTRRAADPGPATKPTDKTDITPYTNHIYVSKPKHRRKRGDSLDDGPIRHMPPTRRETEDEGVKEYLLELAAKEAARQMEEAALAAFPNSRAREGGVAHFYFRESSGSDNSAEDAHHHAQPRARRKSSNLGLNWWHKHMQEHAEHLAHDRRDDAPAPHDQDTLMTTDSDLDDMDLCVPPNPLWTTNQRSTPEDGRDSLADFRPMKENMAPAAHLDLSPFKQMDLGAGQAPAFHLAPDEFHRGRDVERGRPFGAFGLKPEDPTLHLMRQAASPPMLGKDLTFRKCPSPKQTKLETDHPFVDQGGSRECNRDVSGQGGLWKGYCCRSESNGDCVVSADLRRADMIVTPQPPESPREPLTCGRLGEKPSPAASSRGSLDNNTACGMWTAEPGPRTNGAGGQAKKLLQVPQGLGERLEREKARAERDEKILQEFGDEFVTQVYNYLSLGYPATARSFDEELSKISRVSTAELGRDDDRQMAKGHMLEMRLDDTPEDARCPRWCALKVYILQWARSHPDLDNLDPLAWGVRERRGSWAI